MDLPQKLPTRSATISLDGPESIEGTAVGVAKTYISGTKVIQRKRSLKPKEKVILESSSDPNLEMALALSASLAIASRKERGIIGDDTVSGNDNKEVVAQESTESEVNGCGTLKESGDIGSVPDVIMASASSWWKKTLSPVSKKNGVSKRMCGNKGGKTILQTRTDVERSCQISDQVAHILAESNR